MKKRAACRIPGVNPCRIWGGRTYRLNPVHMNTCPPLPPPLQLSQRLNVTAYPYMALLSAMPDNRVQLVAALQV